MDFIANDAAALINGVKPSKSYKSIGCPAYINNLAH